MVVADTSVWIPFFNHPGSAEKREIDGLIDSDRLVLVGVVLAELIQGCRTVSEAETTALPLSDLVIAALALEHRLDVYTIDPHFEQVPGLTLYVPGRSSRR